MVCLVLIQNKVLLSLLVDIGSVLHVVVNVLHPDWLISSNFRLSRSDNLHRDSHPTALKKAAAGIFGFVVEAIS